ncbi:MAG: hypothetical protein FWE05_11440 [Defluviitaleaceae bacterium]|nr:hypothetical protein [Defluviitaleaceae bacterium]
MIAFTFKTVAHMTQAVDLVKDYNPRIDKKSLTMSISVNEGINQVTDILTCLKDGNAQVFNFEQKLPTLEDVFLGLINEESRAG